MANKIIGEWYGCGGCQQEVQHPHKCGGLELEDYNDNTGIDGWDSTCCLTCGMPVEGFCWDCAGMVLCEEEQYVIDQNPHTDFPVLSKWMDFWGSADIRTIAYWNLQAYLLEIDPDYIDF